MVRVPEVWRDNVLSLDLLGEEAIGDSRKRCTIRSYAIYVSHKKAKERTKLR